MIETESTVSKHNQNKCKIIQNNNRTIIKRNLQIIKKRNVITHNRNANRQQKKQNIIEPNREQTQVIGNE